jgi:hypothetical protein
MTTPLDIRLRELLAVDVSTLGPQAFAEHMSEVEQVRSQMDAVLLGRLAAFDRSGAWEVDAAASTTSWLTAQVGVKRQVAGARVRLAGYLTVMPHTMAALAEGVITESHASVLSRCVANPRVRHHFAGAEVELVAWAMDETADELSHRVDAWIELVDEDGAEPHAPQHDTVRANQVGDRVKIDGDLGLETGLPLLAALRERSDQLFRRDRAVSEANPDDGLGQRTTSERQAEALVELVMEGAGAESNPERREPLFVVHVDEETFRSGERHPDTLLELDDGTVVPIDVLERYRCGGRYQSLVLDASRAVLFLGREQRYANRAIRRALAARDRGCAVPGCGRPPEHCDAHHVVWWDNLGESNVDEMALLCRHHHRMVHAGKLEILMIGGRPHFQDQYGNDLHAGRRRPPPVHAA